MHSTEEVSRDVRGGCSQRCEGCLLWPGAGCAVARTVRGQPGSLAGLGQHHNRFGTRAMASISTIRLLPCPRVCTRSLSFPPPPFFYSHSRTQSKPCRGLPTPAHAHMHTHRLCTHKRTHDTSRAAALAGADVQVLRAVSRRERPSCANQGASVRVRVCVCACASVCGRIAKPWNGGNVVFRMSLDRHAIQSIVLSALDGTANRLLR